jgi:hypothetical protein
MLVSERVVLHTTEGDDVDGAHAYQSSRGFAAHFYVGENRIIQARPVTVQASALPAHNDVGIQIEAVGFSNQREWVPSHETLDPLVALGRYLRDECDVPLARPSNWPDDLSDITTILATNNDRRKSRKALSFVGWVGHLEIPDCDPTWHWDPGAFDYSRFFSRVQEADDDVSFIEFLEGSEVYQAKFKASGDPGPPPAERPKHFRDGWSSARFAAANPRAATGVVEPHSHAVSFSVETQTGR